MKEKVQAPELRFPGFTDDWEERKLSTESTITAGGDIDKSKLKEFGEYPIFANALTNDGIVGYYDSYYRVEAPAVTVTGRGDVGHAKARKVNFTPVVRLLAVKSNHDVDFLENAINNHKVLVESTGVPQLTAPQLGNYKIFFPTGEEQEKIGSFFKQLDDTISLHQHKLDLLKEQKKGYLQKMFPKNGEKIPELRFAGFADDWEQRKLIDVKDNEDRYSYTGGPFGSDLKSSDYTEIGVRIIQLQNIGDGKFVNDYKIYTSEEKARSLNSNLIYPGEIIIAKMADPLARATILPKIEPKYLMASDGIRLKINTDYFDNYYILTLINSDVFRKEALNNSTGTTRQRIGLVTLGNLPMMIPSFEEQQKIGSFFKQLDETIDLHQRKLDLLKEQKKGFLQQMFV
ncbi:restriction endonuclease subunit S [Lactococcus hircilactis]|uniref:restriction endonuclease subunit S n=1 Tax=Lactococcus hircilactis TaxID=1494462 RepID=UPI003FA233D0